MKKIITLSLIISMSHSVFSSNVCMALRHEAIEIKSKSLPADMKEEMINDIYAQETVYCTREK